MNNSSTAAVIIIVGLLLLLPASASEKPAAHVVREFYGQHFRTADRMFFSTENVRREKRWLSPRLYRLMLYELQRESEMEREYTGMDAKKPYISGDVFTDSESPPQVFRLGRSQQGKDHAQVAVWCYWDDQTVGRMKRLVQVKLIRISGQWLIDDLEYERGDGLVKMLSRADYLGG